MSKTLDERISDKWVHFNHKIINITKEYPEQDNHWIIKRAIAQEVIEASDKFILLLKR